MLSFNLQFVQLIHKYQLFLWIIGEVALFDIGSLLSKACELLSPSAVVR